MPLQSVMIFGTFDLLHPGHDFVITEAMKRGRVTVIVARDANVKKIKGITPQEPEDARMEAIQKKYPEADVRLGDPNDFLVPVREVKPDLILLGYDQKLPPHIKEEDLGCPIERLPSHAPELFKSSLRRKEG